MATEQHISAAQLRNTADDLTGRLIHLSYIVQLAAFACETRRVLGALDDSPVLTRELRQRLDVDIRTRNTWTTMDDVSGAVLQNAAMQLDEIQTQWCDAAYAAARTMEATAKH